MALDFQEKLDRLPFVEALNAKIALKRELSAALTSKVMELREFVKQQVEKARESNATFGSICSEIQEGKGVFGYSSGEVQGKFIPLGIGNFRKHDGRPCGGMAVQISVRELKGTFATSEVGRFYLFSPKDKWIFFAGEGETLDIGNPLSLEEGVDFVLKELFVRPGKII